MKKHLILLLSLLPALVQPAASQTLPKMGFTVRWNSRTGCPDSVSWTLTSEEASATLVSRTDEFLPDPDAERCPLPGDYSRSGYDRGHMAPAADMKWSETAMRESFQMSNICPQDHTLNEKTWCDLEKQCRVWAKHYGSLSIVCGPLFGASPEKIGKSREVYVPAAFFKVLMKEFRGRTYTIGFIFPNEPTDDSFWTYAVSVDEVESLTGMDFFAGLPDSVETSAESVCRPEDWRYYLIPTDR